MNQNLQTDWKNKASFWRAFHKLSLTPYLTPEAARLNAELSGYVYTFKTPPLAAGINNK
jgi:hypothetical protein